MTTQPVSTFKSSAPAHRPRRRRLVLLAVGIIGAVLAVHFSGLGAWIRDVDRVRLFCNSLGGWVYVVGTLAVAVLVSCGVPRLLFCALGGLLLGFWPGLAVSVVGSVLGYYAAFLFIRWGGRDWVLHHIPKAQRWARLMHRQGVMGVILMRQLPIHGTLANLALGLSHVKHRHFLIGTAIGILPESVPATLIGTGLSLRHIPGFVAVSVIVVLLVWIACAYWLRKMKAAHADEMQAEAEILKGSES